MIDIICNTINDQLTFEWLQQKYGLTFPAGFTLPNTDGKIKVMPFQWGEENCVNENAIYPKDKVGMLSFFEAGTTSPGKRVEHSIIFDQDLRMVCMLNIEYLNPEDHSIASKIMSALYNALQNIKVQTDEVQITKVTYLKALTDSKQILAKYSFDDKLKNNVYPRITFAIDIRVSYLENLCGAEITIQPKC